MSAQKFSHRIKHNALYDILLKGMGQLQNVSWMTEIYVIYV